MSTNHSRILPGKLNAIESQPNRVQMRMKRQVLGGSSVNSSRPNPKIADRPLLKQQCSHQQLKAGSEFP